MECASSSSSSRSAGSASQATPVASRPVSPQGSFYLAEEPLELAFFFADLRKSEIKRSAPQPQTSCSQQMAAQTSSHAGFFQRLFLS